MAGPSGDPFQHSEPLFITFFVMHMFGWIGSSIILLTAIFSSKVKRHTTWMNLSLSWIIACFTYSFLLMTGQLKNPNPNRTVCLAQAAAVYAVPALTAGTTLALAVHVWYTFRPNGTNYSKSPPSLDKHLKRDLVRSVALVAFPYILPICLYIGVIVYGIQHPEEVVLAQSGFYCGLSNSIFGKINAAFVAIAMAPTIILEALVMISLYRNWSLYKANLNNGLNTVIRLGTFTFFGIFAIAISLSYLGSRDYGRLQNVLESMPPVAFVVVFSSQRDVIQAWMFWKPRSASSSNPSSPTDSTSPLQLESGPPDAMVVHVQFSSSQRADSEKAGGKYYYF